ncbi:MAG: 3-dehydroquinate synthase [Burkholderiales bacterium]
MTSFAALNIPAFSPQVTHSPLEIDLGDRTYPIHIGAIDWASQASALQARGRRAVVVTNSTVGPLFAERLCLALSSAYAEVDTLVLPDGESFKNCESLQRIQAHLAATGADRRVTLFALGGGVIGDLCGFAAATYMRGVRFVQVPTTLLSQVDSSVGGKTGINLAEGKNLVGAFHQPVAVWADLGCLASLPEREFSAGLAEVIKYGPIADSKFFDWLEANMDKLRARDREALSIAVRRSCEIKAAVVAADEHEGGVRAILNFGHTFGHALEAGLGYGRLLHGEAVAVGMLMATALSTHELGLDGACLLRLRELLLRAGLPVKAPALPESEFLALMRGDKKAEAGGIRYVLLPHWGEASLVSAPDAAALEAIRAIGHA